MKGHGFVRNKRIFVLIAIIAAAAVSALAAAAVQKCGVSGNTSAAVSGSAGDIQGTADVGGVRAKSDLKDVKTTSAAESAKADHVQESGAAVTPTASPAVSREERIQQEIEEEVREMPLEEKVGQMFLVTPDQLTGVTSTEAGQKTRSAIAEAEPGGLIYFSDNLQSADQTRTMLNTTKQYYQELGLPAPFLAVDEEGGSVARVANSGRFDVPKLPDMCEVGASGDVQEAERAGRTIGAYLADLGFNLDFAPDADVLTNPANTVVAKRSFGSDPQLVKEMTKAESEALLESGVLPALKHFPGHGATDGDSHDGYVSTDKTLDELMNAELVPFTDVQDYAPLIMVGHIAAPNVTGGDLSASLSEMWVTEILRNRLGYSGVVVTDALNMGAITERYTSAQAAVAAVFAGCDLLLMPQDYQAARQGIIDAVGDGTIPEERIGESVCRILLAKEKLN